MPSYRDYVKSSIPQYKLSEANSNAPEKSRYCNFICQTLKNVDQFSPHSYSYCRNCNNLYKLAVKMVEEKKITIEQFKENPQIVITPTPTLETYKQCLTCKEDKNITEFDNRNVCKSCRNIAAKNRATNGLENTISDVEKI